MATNRLGAKREDRTGSAPSCPDSLPDRPRSTAGKVLRLITEFKFEAAIVALLVATLLSIQYHHLLARRTFEITPANASSYGILAYGDARLGGNSTVNTDSRRPLTWSCDLRTNYPYYFCGYELVIDKARTGKGIDLSGYEKMNLSIAYDGPGEWVRFYVKNFDPRYSDRKKTDSAKFNMIEFLDGAGTQNVEVKLSDFSVAYWWLIGNKIPPELSQPQFENIVAIDVQPGTGAKPGRHNFQVESIRFEGTLISKAQWYLLLLSFWFVLICAFLAHRAFNLKRDFEARQRLQERESRQLLTAKAAAESASSAKSQFLASMSHELRTPLNAILGYAQLLQRENLTERQEAAARTIHQSGSHLLTLITDVLDLAKIEAGKLELVPGSMDLASSLRGIADMIKVRAQEKELEFRFECAEALPRFIIADEKRLRQVLINLLGNAVKFTPAGEISLKVHQIGGTPDRPRLRFQIADTGPGIAADKLALIFQPFEQAGHDSGQDGGTGLGLSISRQIVGMMGSSIEVESREGEGSRFWFDIDVEPADRAEVAPLWSKGAITGYAGPRRKLLIVDDIDENRAVLAAMVEQLGFETVEARDGAESVQVARRELPDLILMDIRMPVMDGFEATRVLRTFDNTRNIPIIAVSASTTDEFEAQSVAAGADSFLSKPVDHEELVQLLVWHLKLDWTSAEAKAGSNSCDGTAIVAPPQEQIAILHNLALAGNMRGIKAQADEIAAMGDQYRPFADALRTLAQSYQSPAILRLIEQHDESRQAA